MAYGAIIAAIIGAAASAAAASAAQPKYGDPAKSSAKVAYADFKTLPKRRQVEMLARLGKKGPVGHDVRSWQVEGMPLKDVEALLRQDPTLKVRNGHSAWFDENGKRVKMWRGEILRTRPSDTTADFTGMGDADVEGQLARKMAEAGLELSRKYGSQFIDSAKAQEELADPDGTAARRLLAQTINDQADEQGKTARPVSAELDAQIQKQLDLGRGLDGDSLAAVADVLRRRAEAGDSPTGDIQSELETNPAAEARLNQRLQRGMAYLASGATPEDVLYREKQQNMANMANFLGGRTPTSQFRSLSGGQQGATPIAQGPALPQIDPNSTALGNQAATNNYSLRVRQAAQQVSPWFAGLSALTKGAQVASAGGYQPFKTN